MDTATDGDARCLMDSPQRLGFLPTRWFWRDPANRRLAGWMFAAIAFATIMAGTYVGAHPILVGASLFLTLPLAEGLLEKYIRHQALKRRALAETEARDALPEQSQH